MERRYKAFISYRHLPLDMAVAQKLHRRIERYVVPKELRKDGEKKLGLVFRDRDELPIASDLSANIRQALDASEFLIVICTPETSRSQWVLREIRYFLLHHDRDHVLAVLADGNPKEAFPAELRELRSEDGALVDTVEPLAANIVADSEAKRNRLFGVESLRILAALIGCPFDALYRREQRYRRRRAAVALSAAALIAAAFIGMLLERNAEIRAQLLQSQINESKALAALSEQVYDEGDFTGALELALQALPGTGGDRPYVAEAERALSAALAPYARGQLGYMQSLEQDSRIFSFALSEDGESFVTLDASGRIRAFDPETAALRWSRDGGTLSGVLPSESTGGLLALGPNGVSLYDLMDGTEIWTRSDLASVNFGGLSPSGRRMLYASYGETDPAATETLSVVDAGSGKTLETLELGPGPGRFCAAGALTDGGELAGALLWTPGEATAALCLADLSSGQVQVLDDDLLYSPGSASYRIIFTPEGDLILGCDSMAGASAVRLYAREAGYACRFETPIATEQVAQVDNSEVTLFASLDLLACENGRIAVGSKHLLYELDAESGAILWSCTLPGRLLTARLYSNACLGLALSDGTVTFCTSDGLLSYTQDIYCFNGGYPLVAAALCSSSFLDGVFVLVPESFQQRAAFVRFVDEPAMVSVAARDPQANRTLLFASPDGTKLACLAYDYAARPLSGQVVDLTAGSAGSRFDLPEAELWADPAAISLTDQGLLIAGDTVFDPATGTFTGAAEAVQPLTPEALPLAFDLPPELSKLLYARDGQLLLAFSATGALRVYDARTGALLHSSAYGSDQLSFAAEGAHYEVRELPEEGLLLIFYDDLDRTEGVSIALDMSLWACVGVYQGAAGYCPPLDGMLVCHYLDDVWLCPRRSLSDLMEKAQGILGVQGGI